MYLSQACLSASLTGGKLAERLHGCRAGVRRRMAGIGKAADSTPYNDVKGGREATSCPTSPVEGGEAGGGSGLQHQWRLARATCRRNSAAARAAILHAINETDATTNGGGILKK